MSDSSLSKLVEAQADGTVDVEFALLTVSEKLAKSGVTADVVQPGEAEEPGDTMLRIIKVSELYKKSIASSQGLPWPGSSR